MRKVQIFIWSPNPDQPNKYDKIDNGTGTFHQFSSGYEEFENGPGNYAVAIVERDDGTVETVPADLIRFIDPIKSTANVDDLVKALDRLIFVAEKLGADQDEGGALSQARAALAATGAA